MSGSRPNNAWSIPLKTKASSAPPGLTMPSSNSNSTSRNNNNNNSNSNKNAIRDRFVQLQQTFVGLTVTLHLIDGSILEGVFNTSTPFPAAVDKGLIRESDLNQYVIKACTLKKRGSGAPSMPNLDNFSDGSTVVFPFSKVVQMHIKSCRLQNQPTAASSSNNNNNRRNGGTNAAAGDYHSNNGFQTDTDISTVANGGRNDDLVMAGSAWTTNASATTADDDELGKSRSGMTSSGGEGSSGRSGLFGTAIAKNNGPNSANTATVPNGDMKGSIGNWDQFSANEKQFGTKDTWDENLYTTELKRDDVDKVKVREAERLARAIEGKATSNIHLAEERGQAVEGDFDEEDRYSGVLLKSKDTSASSGSGAGGGKQRTKLALQPRTVGKVNNTPSGEPSSATTTTAGSKDVDAKARSTATSTTASTTVTSEPVAKKPTMNYAAAAAKKGDNNDAVPTTAVPKSSTSTTNTKPTEPSSSDSPVATNEKSDESADAKKEAKDSTTTTTTTATKTTTETEKEETKDSTKTSTDSTTTKEETKPKIVSKLNANAKSFSFNASAKSFVPTSFTTPAPAPVPPPTNDHQNQAALQQQQHIAGAHFAPPYGGHQPGAMQVNAPMMQYYPQATTAMRFPSQNQYQMMQGGPMPIHGQVGVPPVATTGPDGLVPATATNPTGGAMPPQQPLQAEAQDQEGGQDDNDVTEGETNGPKDESGTVNEEGETGDVDQEGISSPANSAVPQAAVGAAQMQYGMPQVNAYYPNMQQVHGGRPQQYPAQMMGSHQQVPGNYMYPQQGRMPAGQGMHNVYGNQMRGAPGNFQTGNHYMTNYGPGQNYHGGGMEDDNGYRGGGNTGRGGRGRGRHNKNNSRKGGRGGNAGRGNYNNYNSANSGNTQADGYDPSQQGAPPPNVGGDQNEE